MNLWVCHKNSSLFCCDCRKKLVTFCAGVAYRPEQIEGLFRVHLDGCPASRAWVRWAEQADTHFHPFQIGENQSYDDTPPHRSNGPLEPFVRRLLQLENWPGMEAPTS